MIRKHWPALLCMAMVTMFFATHLTASATPQGAKPLIIQAHDYVATVDRVVDGDTVDLHVKAWPTFVLQDRFRLKGINAPETRGAEKEQGKISTQWLIDKLAPHAQIIVRIPTDNRGDRARGKYGRWLATILVPGADGTLIDLNALMVHEGMAKVANY